MHILRDRMVYMAHLSAGIDWSVDRCVLWAFGNPQGRERVTRNKFPCVPYRSTGPWLSAVDRVLTPGNTLSKPAVRV